MRRTDFLRVVDGDGGHARPKRLLIEFHPEDPPEQLALFSDAAATHLIPVLRAALAKLEAGELRMPLDGSLRWTEDGA